MAASSSSYQDAICGAVLAAMCYMKARQDHQIQEHGEATDTEHNLLQPDHHCDDPSLHSLQESGDNLAQQRGDNLAQQGGDNLTRQRGDNLTQQRGDNLTQERGDNLTQQRGNNLNQPQEGQPQGEASFHHTPDNGQGSLSRDIRTFRELRGHSCALKGEDINAEPVACSSCESESMGPGPAGVVTSSRSPVKQAQMIALPDSASSYTGKRPICEAKPVRLGHNNYDI